MTDQETMYALGQVAQLVYGPTAMPPAAIDTILTQPAKGLGLMTRSQQFAAADQDEMTELMDKLDAPLPAGPISPPARTAFWTGYYHYAAARAHTKRYGPTELRMLGEALYGERWQSNIAHLIGVDSRRVRAWLARERPIPAGVWAEIAAAARERQITLDDCLKRLCGD